MNVGKAKCLTPAIRPHLHGWKENAVDGVYFWLHHRVGYRTTLAEKREMRAARVLLCQCSAIADAVLEPKMFVVNRILFLAMQFGRIAGVEALCFAWRIQSPSATGGCWAVPFP